MADENGSTPPLVEELQHLQSAATESDFFQFMRRVEALYADKPRLGWAAHPRDEPVRLGQKPSTAFAPTAIRSFKLGADDAPHRLDVAFLGMFGPNGPLPLALTDHAQRSSSAARRLKREDPFVDLVDMFHQRVLTLLHRTWASSRAAVQRDRPSKDTFDAYLGSLTGAAARAEHETVEELRGYARRFVGLYANQTRNAEGLEAIASALLHAPVEVQPLIGEWIDIPPDYAWKLGEAAPRNALDLGLLGESAVLGPQVFERQYKFRLQVGPVGQELLQQLLPGGALLARLHTLVRSYVGDELRWDLLVLMGEAIRAFHLGEPSSLGDTTYLAVETQDMIAHHIVDPLGA